MTRPTAVIFDIGRVLFDWDLRYLYEQLIADAAELDSFLREVVTPAWHFQHDAGRPFAETSAELIARHPHHAALIAQLHPRFNDTNRAMMPGMASLVDDLHGRDIPLYAITNFSGEFFPSFRNKWAHVFDRFRGIVVSGDEKLVKPDPAIYALALDRFGLRGPDAVFVDDSRANVDGAAAAGMQALLFTNAATLRHQLVALELL